jgi:hypothetical protein
MHCVVDMIFFLDRKFTDEDTWEDDSMHMLETISYYLQQLTPVEKETFKTFLDRLAQEEERPGGDASYANELRSLFTALSVDTQQSA